MAEKCLKKRILSVVIIIAILFSFLSCDKKDDDRLQEYEMRRAEIQLEKQGYINEQYSLRMGLDDYTGHHSFMSFVFLSVDSALYTDVLPIFNTEDQPLVGVMALSLNELPGMEGNITLEQYSALSELGWESALYWAGPELSDGEFISADESAALLESYLSSIDAALETLGIDMPVSLVVGCEVAGSEYDAVLEKFGIENLLHDYKKLEDLVSSDRPEGVWHSGVLGWRDLMRSTRVKKLVESKGGYASFMVLFDNSPENYDTSFFSIEGENNSNGVRRDVFVRMLDNFRTSISDSAIAVVGIDGARAKSTRYHDMKDGYLVDSAKRIAELDALIADADKRLFDLYEEYFG